MGLISNGSTIFDAGSMASGFGGSMVFIKKLTASSSSTLSFVDGSSSVVLDNTYKEYLFTFKNIHPATDGAIFQCNGRDGSSSYDATKTTTFFYGYNNEGGSDSVLEYNASYDAAQSTSAFRISNLLGNGNDESYSGTMHLFNPSSTTFVKHFLVRANHYQSGDYSFDINVAGYFNVTAAIDAIQFSMSSGNIDAGDICLYGIA